MTGTDERPVMAGASGADYLRLRDRVDADVRGALDLRRSTSRELDIQDYLDAAIDAGGRSRAVTITMVVACALVFVAVINSLQNAWMLQRIHAANDPMSDYVISKIGPPPTTSDDRMHSQRYDAFYSSMWKSYIDNSYYVRVPFFGFGIDANDIGVFAGMAFLIILLMMRFCLAREIENLRGAFHRVTDAHDRYEFYMLLSMRQVFTVPRTELVRRSLFSATAPKAVWLAPVAIESLVAWHDYRTNGVGQQIDDLHTFIILWANALAVGLVLLFTVSVIQRMLLIDRLWDRYWADILETGVARPPSVYVPSLVGDPIRWLMRAMFGIGGRAITVDRKVPESVSSVTLRVSRKTEMATAKSTGGKKDDDAVSDMGGMAKEKKKQKDSSSDGKKSK